VQAGAKDTTDGVARSATTTMCYSSAAKVPPQSHLLVTVDHHNECLLLPIMGVYVPFHITTVKAVNYSQDGEAHDKVHAHVRIQFNTMPSYDARQAFPKAAFIKELSFRSAKAEAAHRFVQV
jgi:nucleosome binding factor SPN SPT16 subunit